MMRMPRVKMNEQASSKVSQAVVKQTTIMSQWFPGFRGGRNGMIPGRISPGVH